ncbi:hypothetical protein ACFQS3_03555 [Glycomyces mayteni]|uniref:Uncharacterized protein n=1 Tax=Glycomyces mayteni TaxID=543887 RepID=A0ABW2D594_9ACTN|nr:hypothetical protein GCM10025732_50450 [Glycomyces mayteni]
MSSAEIKAIAMLLRARNAIDERIADVVGRPVVHGHLSDWIAAQVFDIALEPAANKVVDGFFRSGPLAGRSVNIKHYTRNQGMLDMTDSEELDTYLVMTGPRGGPSGSAGAYRPWSIEHVYLFDAQGLYDTLHAEMRRIGVATSIPSRYWDQAEIHPVSRNANFPLSAEQTAALEEFRAGRV